MGVHTETCHVEKESGKIIEKKSESSYQEERSFALPSNAFIAFIFFAKGERPVDLDLVTIIVLFCTLFTEGLRLVFFFVRDISSQI